MNLFIFPIYYKALNFVISCDKVTSTYGKSDFLWRLYETSFTSFPTLIPIPTRKGDLCYIWVIIIHYSTIKIINNNNNIWVQQWPLVSWKLRIKFRYTFRKNIFFFTQTRYKNRLSSLTFCIEHTFREFAKNLPLFPRHPTKFIKIYLFNMTVVTIKRSILYFLLFSPQKYGERWLLASLYCKNWAST